MELRINKPTRTKRVKHWGKKKGFSISKSIQISALITALVFANNINVLIICLIVVLIAKK